MGVSMGARWLVALSAVRPIHPEVQNKVPKHVGC